MKNLFLIFIASLFSLFILSTFSCKTEETDPVAPKLLIIGEDSINALAGTTATIKLQIIGANGLEKLIVSGDLEKEIVDPISADTVNYTFEYNMSDITTSGVRTLEFVAIDQELRQSEKVTYKVNIRVPAKHYTANVEAIIDQNTKSLWSTLHAKYYTAGSMILNSDLADNVDIIYYYNNNNSKGNMLSPSNNLVTNMLPPDWTGTRNNTLFKTLDISLLEFQNILDEANLLNQVLTIEQAFVTGTNEADNVIVEANQFYAIQLASGNRGVIRIISADGNTLQAEIIINP